MIQIQIVGPGCAGCEKLAALCRQVITENDIEATIAKVTDLKKIADLGIFLTPGLVIDGDVKASGKIPTKHTLLHWIKEYAQHGRKG